MAPPAGNVAPAFFAVNRPSLPAHEPERSAIAAAATIRNRLTALSTGLAPSRFSVDGSACIAAADRAGPERLLHYCARPPLAAERLRELDPEHLFYATTRSGAGETGSLHLTPLQLLDDRARNARDVRRADRYASRKVLLRLPVR